ncbi:SDR family oxidoreductase [Indiicoccus explosivorum]|uniref:SDR family oxidoreductase n=1 Tax=Indiicoccus explosivorum TaxID=1917864 RepID=UPI000B4371F4|nr:SDR family oxidoreductase [Indiicoccus explosivorum]
MAKTIFITGAGSGLGKGAALGLAEKGHKIIAGVEILPQKTDLIREAEERGLEIEVLKLDITNPRDVSRIEDYDFDIFVANAAINEEGPLAEVPMDRFRALFEVNVFGTLATAQEAIRHFVKKGSGKIIFTSSMAGIAASKFVGPYSATKHAIEALAETLRKEMKDFGIQVATINPGTFETGFNRRAAEEKWEWYDQDKNFTPKESMEKAEEGLKDQYDPEGMIEKMIEIIPADHHKFRTVYPEATEEQLKKTQKERWEMEI